MAEKKQKAPKFSTPKGTFKFPRLGEPDTKFKPEGEYSVKVLFSVPEIAPLLEKLKPLHEQAEADGRVAYAELPVATRKKLEAKGGGFCLNPLYTDVYDDEENPTGEVEMNFKMTASGEYKKGTKVGQKWTRRPDVFDAKMKKMDGAKVWGGSVGRISFEVVPYFIKGTGAAGLSLKLQAAQVVELVSGGQRNASSYGFGEEDGYADEGAVEESKDKSADTGAEGSANGEPQDF